MFVDTGPCTRENWPVGDPERAQWVRRMLTERPSRSNIVFAHHSRLSRGKHGDNKTVSALWDALFDASGAPLAALTVGGHDHNVREPRISRAVDAHGLVASTTRRADCWDDAVAESYFSTLKLELVYESAWQRRTEAWAAVGIGANLREGCARTGAVLNGPRVP